MPINETNNSNPDPAESDRVSSPDNSSSEHDLGSSEHVSRNDRLSLLGVLATVAKACNSLPFAGKMTTRAAAHNVWKEPNVLYKSVRMTEAMGILGFSIWMHSKQLKKGANRLKENRDLHRVEPSAATITKCAIDIAYVAANSAAIFAQLHLTGRLITHFAEAKTTSIPLLSAWGIQSGVVDYQLAADKLFTAIQDGNQADIDTFFMLLPPEEKQAVLKEVQSLHSFTVLDNSFTVLDDSFFVDLDIADLSTNISYKSRLRYIADLIINAHSVDHSKQFSIKERIIMYVVTLGGQLGFSKLG
ncbi:hypothetical protein KA012_04585 [Candidatus Woesebacteria bacterium]|nr:hypothetical protein [Candidatus Woesebacteria bacterium]